MYTKPLPLALSELMRAIIKLHLTLLQLHILYGSVFRVIANDL
jgi:hypothetical protein